MAVLTQLIYTGVAALAVSALLTFIVRAVARRYGLVAKPNSERWHKKPTAMYGGVSIFLTTLILYAAFVPKTEGSLVIMAGSSFLFLVGLLDDILNIKPYQKLIGQMIGTATVVGFGMRLPLTGIELLDITITVVWLIGITNAINLLDNMDGLAAGIAAIAAIALAFGFYANGQANELLLIAVFIGALLGFLVFNFNPASIFMGDCGSMFVGFLLASSVLLNQVGGRSRGIFPILAVPVLILFVPIFDTTFVTVLRKLWGRKASQGGRDHTSHRLVALGLSERSSVLMLYAFAVIAGLASLLARELETTQSLAMIAVFTIILVIVGVYLSKVKVYEETDEAAAMADNAVFAFLVNVSHKRRLFEVFLDVLLISLAYYISYVLLFGSFEHSGNWPLFIESLPLLIVIKLFAFLAIGVYRGVWRYTGIGDIITYAKAVTAGSIASVSAILLLYRFENFSRAVFILDGIILLFFVVGSRMAFRLIRQMLPAAGSNGGIRVLIYGAGDGGELVLREMRNNPSLHYKPVAFLDDDPLKQGKVINGLKVFAGDEITEICREMKAEEVLISIRGLDHEKLREIRDAAGRSGVELKRAELRIEAVEF